MNERFTAIFNEMSKRELKFRIKYQKKEIEMTPDERLNRESYVNFRMGYPRASVDTYEVLHEKDKEHLRFLQDLLKTKYPSKKLQVKQEKNEENEIIKRLSTS